MYPTRRWRRATGVTMTYLALLFALFVTLFPIGWTLATSLKGEAEYFARPPIWIPNQPTLSHYLYLFTDEIGGKQALLTSVGVALTNTILVLLLAIPAAYAISRYRIGGNNLPIWFLSMRMMPPIAPVFPLFLLFFMIGLLDTPQALVITYITFNLPFAIWLLMGFFEDFPREIQEQAMVDGCSELAALFRVIIPILLPGIIVVGLFCFTFAFNEFLFASALTRGNTRTMMVLLASFQAPQRYHYGEVAAAAIVGVIPALVLCLFFQRYLVKGLAMGGLKG